MRREKTCSVYLPISQTFDGNQTERVVYQLTALEANAPMPKEAPTEVIRLP